MGDFNDDPTFWSDVGQIVTGLIPIAGQLGDARDLIHALDDITNKEGYKKIGSWAGLVLIVIGFVPGVGDTIKSIGRRGIRYLDNNRITKRIGQWLGDNVISPILDRVGDITAPIVGQIKDAIRRKLAEAQEIARQLGNGAGSTTSVTGDELRGRWYDRHQPTITEDIDLPAGEGYTDKYGNITVSPHGTPEEQLLVLRHEQVHSMLSPKLELFREFRADLNMSAYQKSSFLRYLEEALAETYAQLRVNGINVTNIYEGIKFPIANGYVTLTAVVTEAAIGTVVIGGVTYGVYTVASENEQTP